VERQLPRFACIDLFEELSCVLWVPGYVVTGQSQFCCIKKQDFAASSTLSDCSRIQTVTMPGPIRTALKVDLKKPAAEQPYLHVSQPVFLVYLDVLLIFVIEPMAP
jgi:hypothetical protein